MNTQQAVAARLQELCAEKHFTPNAIATFAAVPQGTVASILNGKSKNPDIVVIKKLCDGFGITLGEFFATPAFDALEQELQ